MTVVVDADLCEFPAIFRDDRYGSGAPVSFRRVFRIRKDVQEYLLEVSRISENPRSFYAFVEFQGDPGTLVLRPDEAKCDFDRLMQINRGDLDRLLFGKREKTVGDGGYALNSLPMLFAQRFKGGVECVLFSEKFPNNVNVSLHDAQWIIDLVCDAGREGADGRHFRGLDQLRLGRLQGRQIAFEFLFSRAKLFSHLGQVVLK